MPICFLCRTERDVEQFSRFEDGKIKRNCQECLDQRNQKYNSKYTCPCGRPHGKFNCINCFPELDCGHGKVSYYCNICRPDKIFYHMVHNSRKSDKKYDRYDDACRANFITQDWCKGTYLVQEKRCFHCHEEMNLIPKNPLFVSIERLDNSVGHTKDNCVIACITCNKRRVGDMRTADERAEIEEVSPSIIVVNGNVSIHT